MKSQDILVALKLVCLEQAGRDTPDRHEARSVRGLADALGVSKSEISNALNRLFDSGLAVRSRRTGLAKVNARALHDLIVSGVRYVFPAKPGPLARGVPTAYAAPVLKDKLMSAGETKLVWPDAEGHESGQSVMPLFRSVPFAVRNDPRLYAYLALVDAIRLGNPREATIAKQELQHRLNQDG